MLSERDLGYDPATTPFDATTTRYNPHNALGLAAMSNLAYKDEQDVLDQVDEWGFDRCKFLQGHETQGFVAGDREKVIVAFRGTEPTKLRDWLTDVKIRKIAGPAGRVHEGFDEALARVWPELRAHIDVYQDAAEGPKSLWFTGHSLGAALASLAVARLRFGAEDRPVYGLYTFGQPRTGDRAFAGAFSGDSMCRAFRFVNNNDIVPRVPPRELGYRHVGRFVYFTEDGKLTTEIGWWMRLLDRARGRIEDLGELGTEGVKDHDMNDYIRLVRDNLEAPVEP